MLCLINASCNIIFICISLIIYTSYMHLTRLYKKKIPNHTKQNQRKPTWTRHKVNTIVEFPNHMQFSNITLILKKNSENIPKKYEKFILFIDHKDQVPVQRNNVDRSCSSSQQPTTKNVKGNNDGSRNDTKYMTLYMDM